MKLRYELDHRTGRRNSQYSPVHWFFLLISVGIVFSLLAGCPSNSKTANTPFPGKLGEVFRRGTLIIATDAEYPPSSEFLPDAPRAENTRCASNEFTANQARGFDVDVAVEIARRLGVEPCFVFPPWSQIVSGGWNDHWDVSVGSMAITTERIKVLYFSQPYTTGAAVVFVHKDNQTYQKPADLSGKKIGACAGCAYEYYLNGTLVIPGTEIEFQIKNPIVIGYDTDTTALENLAKGDGVELDAVLTDPDTGSLAIADGMPIKQLGEPVYRDYVAAAVDKAGSSDPIPLVKKITEIIQQMHKDGFLKALSIKIYSGDFATSASQYDINALQQYPFP